MKVMNAGNRPDSMKPPHSGSAFVCRLGAAFRASDGVKDLPECEPLFMAVMSNMTEADVSFPFTSACSIQIYLSNQIVASAAFQEFSGTLVVNWQGDRILR
jgi:hypothetical protein